VAAIGIGVFWLVIEARLDQRQPGSSLGMNKWTYVGYVELGMFFVFVVVCLRLADLPCRKKVLLNGNALMAFNLKAEAFDSETNANFLEVIKALTSAIYS